MAKQNLDKTNLTEVYPMDLGAFMLYDQSGYKMPMNHIQKIFNEPMWKSYYIDGKGRFVVVDNRCGGVMELKIKQF